MRKYKIGIAVLLFAIVLMGCGEKSQEDVRSKLEETAQDLQAYQAEAKMTLKTGQDDQVYHVNIAHKKEDLYRVLLKNENDEESSQIILKNEDGVFVLTPALNKSFKFQSDWPENNSQPYLYQSLIKDVIDDSEATFTSTENYYVFRTKTNYKSNTNLPYQELYFDKKSLTPILVKVLDKDDEALVEVEFQQFEIDPDLPKDTFLMDNNMSSSLLGIPAMAEGETQQDFSILYPTEKLGAELVEMDEHETDHGKRVMLSYEGEKNFTIIEETIDVMETSGAMTEVPNGEPVNLGFTTGAQTESSLKWSYNGVNYYLASEELTKEEMISVAGSISAQSIK